MTHKALKLSLVAGIIAGTTLTVSAYYARRGDAAPELSFGAVTRGSIVSTVAAMGTLEAVTTIQVGTQVSGAIQSLHADFNSIVRQGQVLARLDPSLYQSAIEQARASLTRAEAERDRLKVMRDDAVAKLQRARELAGRQLIPASELDAAQVTLLTAAAQVTSAAAAVTQARAALTQADVNLAKTVISSPIAGIVIARNIDVGQTVAASLQAPTLFVIAADLRSMQLKAQVDEADLGRITAGQRVTFTVDAYPNETFTGTVEQVRLNPVIEQNVVTYAAIVSAPNAELKLKPGMTASLTMEVARRDDVLRVPGAALRFKPNTKVLQALQAGSATPVQGAALWQYEGGVLKQIPVRVGATDGSFVELIDALLDPGMRVVTGVKLDAAASAAQSRPASSPLLPTSPPRR